MEVTLRVRPKQKLFHSANRSQLISFKPKCKSDFPKVCRSVETTIFKILYERNDIPAVVNFEGPKRSV